MTAFEPPDFTYFSGLQFNPEIYENPLTETTSAILPPNPTFTSVSTPIVYTDQIQRYTASIINLFNSPAVVAVYMGLASTLFNIGNVAIIGSNILPNGVSQIALGETASDTIIQALTCYIVADAAFELTSGASTKVRVEPTLAYIKAATTTIRDAASNILASFTSSAIGFTTALLQVVQGATTTMSLTEASTTFRNTTDWAVMSPVTILKDQLGNFRLYVTSTFTNITNASIRIFSAEIECIPFSPATTFSFLFKTNTADDTITTSSIVASGGTTALTGTITTTAATTTMVGGTLNLNQTSAINQTNTAATTTFNGPTSFPTTSEIRVGAVSGTYPLYTNLPTIGITNTAGGGTVNFPGWSGMQYDSVYYFGTSCTGTYTAVLQNSLRMGNKIRIMNLGTGTVNVQISAGTARMFGSGLARAGAINYPIPPLQGASFTCVDGSGITGIGGNNYFVGAF
jgi:hypothetical protein